MHTKKFPDLLQFCKFAVRKKNQMCCVKTLIEWDFHDFSILTLLAKTHFS